MYKTQEENTIAFKVLTFCFICLIPQTSEVAESMSDIRANTICGQRADPNEAML